MSKLSRAFNLIRGQYRPPHSEPVDLGGTPVAEGFSARHLLKLVADAPMGALSFPSSVPALNRDIPAEELVLAAERGGEARVYPARLLRRYHVVNDVLGGGPFTVTFCPRCFSGVAFDPVVEGTALVFDVFGLYQGTMVMKDQQTGTIWTPLDGRALAGSLLGRHLTMEPVQMSSFGAWMELHPDSTTPADATPPKPHARRPGDPLLDERLPQLVSHWDERLGPRTLVLGIELNGSSRAHVLDPNNPGPQLLQTEMAGTPIVLLAEPGGWPLAYDRRIAGCVIEFRLERDRVVDESGSSWMAGRAIDGPLKGTELEFISSHLTEWHAWAAYHPDTEIVG